ncbi:MAG: thioredoxin family protein [Conexivisphaerales archaeon]
MPLLEEDDRRYVQDLLSKSMKDPVKLIVFTQEFECEYCKETREIAEELASLSDKIKVETYDLLKHADKAYQTGVDKIPALIVTSDATYNVKYFGIPSGYEFTSLLDDIIDTSKKSTRISQATRQKIKSINQPVHIQVFVTPTCPYCPRAVRLAHQFAMENPAVKADMIESIEFPHLANKYEVMAVPKIVINDSVSFEGALPEPHFLSYVLLALEGKQAS